MQQHIRCRPKQKELPCARALAPSHVDLPTEGLEQVRHLLNLIEDNELADLFIQIEIGLCQDLSIRVSFQIEVYRRALLGYFKRKCCLANLPGSQEDSSRLSVERGSHGLCCLALIHTLQLFRHMEDLQG
jgi:hypothetical protein